ncbi:MAG: DedA family protein [Propionibacteriales bacterium]|nr:DedA family protein [Propionibacteriales bacterium]
MPDLHALDPAVLLGVAAVLVLVQCSLVVGFLVPAGKASVLAGVLAGAGQLDLVLTYLSLAAAAIAGAGVGFLLGRRHGTALVEHRLLARHGDRVERARDLVHRRAGFSLLAGRSVAVLRATTPALAGAAGVGVRRFVVFNVLGGLLWAAVFVGSGFLGGRLLPDLQVTPAAALVVGVVALALTGFALSRRTT